MLILDSLTTGYDVAFLLLQEDLLSLDGTISSVT